MQLPLKLSTVAAAAVAILVYAGSATRAAPPEVEIHDDLQYGVGGGEKLLLDLARPTKLDKPTPCIVFIHGGGWAAGNRKAHYNHMRQAAEDGFIAATISYRLVKDGKHRWPAQIEDGKCAIRWLRANAERFSIDPERIGAIGYSAGAHLSMLLGTLDKDDDLEGDGGSPDQSSKVQAVVAYFGPTNLTVEYPPSSRNIVANFIGGPLDEQRADYDRASPLRYVSPGDATMLLFHGTKDELVPYEQAFEMATALTKAGVPGRVEILLGHRHGWGGDTAEHTERRSMEFFRSTLKLDAAP
ncbi:MAG: alpha/beta hydrolase [Pirellulales bacterium]